SRAASQAAASATGAAWVGLGAGAGGDASSSGVGGAGSSGASAELGGTVTIAAHAGQRMRLPAAPRPARNFLPHSHAKEIDTRSSERSPSKDNTAKREAQSKRHANKAIQPPWPAHRGS